MTDYQGSVVKYLQLLDLLVTEPTMAAITQQLGVSERTARSYLAGLRGPFECVIDFDRQAGAKCYRLLDSGRLTWPNPAGSKS